MKKNYGFSLIELMVGIAIGLVILIGVSGMFSSTLQQNVSLSKQQRFEQTSRVLMNLMASEIRRSGFANPGITLTNQSSGSHYYADDSCILLSHSTPDEDEIFLGFKLVSEKIYMYSQSTNGTCDPGDITDWTALNDINDVKIKMLWFDEQEIDFSGTYDCSTAPTAAASSSLVRITLGVEAVGLFTDSGVTPVKRCLQMNVERRNL